jgi:DNA helicase-2/ATP-dependent DNA helicase PcrA
VEQHFDSGVGAPLVSLEENLTDDPVDVIDWIEAFESSPFASLTPVAIEEELHLPLGGHIVICKIDAVFEIDNKIHIVDWKTGKEPSDADDVFRKSLQLSAYRAAWSSWRGVPEESITASFWYSGTGNVLTPEKLPNRSELEALLLETWGS